MSQSLTGVGLAVNFGFVATSAGSDFGVTATNLSGHLLQKVGLKTSAEIERVRALQGDVMSENYYGIEEELNLAFVISASSRANAKTATSLANFQPGVIIAITAAPSHPDSIYSYWIIQPGAEIPQEITKSAELMIPLKKVPNITAVQS